jgi:hypothetical protein
MAPDGHAAEDREPLRGQIHHQGRDHLSGDVLEQIETLVRWPEKNELANVEFAEPRDDIFRRVG